FTGVLSARYSLRADFYIWSKWVSFRLGRVAFGGWRHTGLCPQPHVGSRSNLVLAGEGPYLRTSSAWLTLKRFIEFLPSQVHLSKGRSICASGCGAATSPERRRVCTR